MQNITENKAFKAITAIIGLLTGFASIFYGLDIWGYGHADNLAYSFMAVGFATFSLSISYLWAIIEG